jgi:hypothetical protein
VYVPAPLAGADAPLHAVQASVPRSRKRPSVPSVIAIMVSAPLSQPYVAPGRTSFITCIRR